MFARMSRYHAVARVSGRHSASGGCHYLASMLKDAALNPRVRGSSPWWRTRSDLGFYRSRSLFLILCGAALRPAWGREMFEMPAHPAALCPSGASFAYGHDDNRRSACARRCGSVRLAFSCLGQRRVCRVRPEVRFTSEGWSSQAGAAPAVRAADLPGRMRPRPPRVPGLAASECVPARRGVRRAWRRLWVPKTYATRRYS